ncbi:N-acetylmuramoyl-L-alanine amidase [Enterovirga aerilata]|uniref:N-acetylmuramoyl-L-alanine amidase n=1 Tax=Enterovirga aerilata TaxID=2730920 RepID=A0A849IES2_9HYPH|nr:N-acetylmuramoyl-L-alanine amidase [Enterovirga sp. DB1703]NNM74590.1 N-acetylmuramoyl-L-alanine amidase [Enterovirga sp. DB1703]
MLDASAGRRTAKAVGLALALGAALFGRPCAATQPGPADRAVAIAAEVAAEGSRTLLTLTLSRPVSATAFLMERPDRAVLELPEVNFQLGGEGTKRRAGVVSSFRCGLFAPGRSRIVMDLSAPALVTRVESREAGPAGASLLTVELTRTDRETFRRTAAADQADLTLTTGSLPAPQPGEDRRPLVAIDAGHGGVDPGATAPNGTLEKDVTFAFASVLRDRLAGDGRYRVLMIRDHDVFVPLEERVRRAREAGADLFLSIHADFIGSPQVSGATIYTGSDRATDHEAASVAERENAADQAGGLVRASAPGEVVDILQELTLRETRAFSHRFSGLLLRDLAPVMRFSAQPQREAGFKVLRTPDLPSVLIELGYLSNARDLEHLLSPEWRERTSAAMATAIDRFFSARVGARAPMSP